MTTSRILLIAVAGLAGAAVFSLGSAARAQPTTPPADDGRGYEYRFGDDDLLAAGLDGTAPIIRVSPHATRSQLIRPRTSFVPELLKSGDSF